MGDAPQVDTAEQIYISSLALLKMLKHGGWRGAACRWLQCGGCAAWHCSWLHSAVSAGVCRCGDACGFVLHCCSSRRTPHCSHPANSIKGSSFCWHACSPQAAPASLWR